MIERDILRPANAPHSSRPAKTLRIALAVIVGSLAITLPAHAADDAIAKANQLYRDVKPGKRTEDVLFAALAKLQAPPAGLSDRRAAMLLPATAASFKAAADWANATDQREALAAMSKAAEGKENLDGRALTQGYGEAAAGGTERVQAGLYSDVGTPPMLAALRPIYLERYDRLLILANVEATRLAADGKPAEAIGVLTDALFVSRQIVDREMAIEQRWAYAAMEDLAERIRDIAYVDTRGLPGQSPVAKLTPDAMIAANERLFEEGYLRTDLLRLPRGEPIALQQVLDTAFEPGGGPRAADFSGLMARLGSTQQPLRLFAESAKWEGVAAGHPNLADTKRAMDKIFGDWSLRWPLDPFDARNSFESDYAKLDKARFPLLAALVPDLGRLFFARQSLRAQLVGTRTSLALVGFQIRSRNLAPDVPIVRPTFLKRIEDDAFNDDRAKGRVPPLQFFVPVRDFGRGAPSKDPVTLTLALSSGGTVSRTYEAKEFVLYSIGPDKVRGYAQSSHDRAEPGQGGDLLLWPPALSLEREDLLGAGKLK